MLVDTPLQPRRPACAAAPCPPAALPWVDGSGLVLRRFVPGDAGDVAALHAWPAVRDQLVDDHPLDQPAIALDFVQRLQPFYQQHPGLGIWHASDAAGFVGWFSLMPMASWPGAVELGSRLHPRAWGTGVAMNGGEAVLRHAFDALGQPAVWAACAPENRGARLCLGALGFKALTMAPYDTRPALFHHLALAGWRSTLALPRRLRLRQAVAGARHAAPS
jgi:RimJ/RimL family protein N-acetyltransferase